MRFLLVSVIFISNVASGQQNYCDFEGIKSISFGPYTGVMDSLAVNPYPDNVDSSAHCAKYTRDGTLYDNFKLYPHLRLSDITSYATNSPLAPKITIKVYTSAPLGTVIEFQLGSRSDDTYPTGFHSQFRTHTTAINSWQDLEFDFIQLIPGGLVSTIDIDKILVLVHPNSLGTETIYFDDLSGPPLIPAAVGSYGFSSLVLYQCHPNPTKGLSHIDFEVKSEGDVMITLCNLLGEPILELLSGKLGAGKFSVPVPTDSLPNGMYFYVLSMDGAFAVQKLVVSR